MTDIDEELKITVRRNQLLGMWAAEKLGLSGQDAEAYARHERAYASSFESEANVARWRHGWRGSRARAQTLAVTKSYPLARIACSTSVLPSDHTALAR